MVDDDSSWVFVFLWWIFSSVPAFIFSVILFGFFGATVVYMYSISEIEYIEAVVLERGESNTILVELEGGKRVFARTGQKHARYFDPNDTVELSCRTDDNGETHWGCKIHDPREAND